MIRAALLLLACTTCASADPARVLSGEHGDFTRLVLELPDSQGWTLGRTETGYGFATEDAEQPQYDLTSVWRRIPRTRLANLAADPKTGFLMIDLGCDCHVFPFEYQPGVVVLDIKAGAAPTASAFEQDFGAAQSAAPSEPVTSAPSAYDWLGSRDGTKAASATGFPLPMPTGNVSLKPLHDELLEQIARGAADGIVDMELPADPGTAELGLQDLPWSNIHLGEAAGLRVTDPDTFVEGTLATSICPEPELLDLPAWGAEEAPMDLLAGTRNGLFGEFDAPETDTIIQSTQHLLYLGFGAEAYQTAKLAGDDAHEELGLYKSIALIIDGEPDPQTPFAKLLDCDSPAALWAALAHDRLPINRGIRRDAILRAFTGLPPHLRRHLGPRLVEKFLALDDAEAARMVRDAMERAPQAEAATVALLDAKEQLHREDAAAAQTYAEDAVALDGDEPDALLVLVEAHFRRLEPLRPETADILQSLQGVAEGTSLGPGIDRAVVLSLALSGQTDAAFGKNPTGQDLADLWRVVANQATDDDFLKRAVLPAAATPPSLHADVAGAIAKRLIALAFPDAALTWLGPPSLADPADKLRLAAEAYILQGDARSALTWLDGQDDPEASALRARALLQLDDLSEAEAALLAAGDAESTTRLSAWKGDWAKLDPSLPDPWQKAAAGVASGTDEQSAGLLGRGASAVETSATARAAVEALLASVGSPSSE